MINDSYGFHVGKRDEKNRVIIPSAMGAEPNEVVVIIKYGAGYKIISKELFDKALDAIETEIAKIIRLDKKVVTVLDLYGKKEDNEELKMLESYRNSLCYAVVRQSKVDGQRRILIGDIYEGEKEVYLIGARDSILLLNKEAYLAMNNDSVTPEEALNVKKLG